METPEVRYAKTRDGLNIAFQTFGSGPPLVLVPGIVGNVELWWEHELFRRVLEYHARHMQWTMFDKRGLGLSDRFLEHPTLEQRIEDIDAVMDAAGLEQAHVIGISEGGVVAQLFAATRPERVDRLCLISSAWGDDQLTQLLTFDTDGTAAEHIALVLPKMMERIIETWGEGPTEMIRWFAPSQLHNESFVRWFGRWQRLTATRADFQRQVESLSELTLGDASSRIQAPTLVIHVSHERVIPRAAARFLVDVIPNARLAEFPGTDHMLWVQPNWQEIGDVVIEFLTGKPAQPSFRCQFATILFTDIVNSTLSASKVGNERWRDTMDSHDRIAWRTTDRYHGRIVKSTGDGMLAIFDTPSAAVRCAIDLRRELESIGLKLRLGLHAGEIEVRNDADVTGLAVNVAARVEQAADAGTVLVSSTVRDLLQGSGFTFTLERTQPLKGVEGNWTLYSLG